MGRGFEIGDKIRKVGDDGRWVVTGLHSDGTAYAVYDTDRYVREAVITVGKRGFWAAARRKGARR